MQIIHGSRHKAKSKRESKMNYLSIFPSYKVNYALLRIAVPYFWIRACKIAVLYNISYLLLTFLLFFHQYEMNPETGDFTHKESRVS